MTTIGATLPQTHDMSTARPAAAREPRDDITIGQALSAVAGAAAGAVIQGVGNTAASVIRLPQAVFQGYKTLWNTERIGPVLKATIGALIPAAAVATPVLTALGSVGYGMVRGWEDGMEHGLASAVKESARDVKRFYRDMTGRFIEELKEYETRPLPPGEEPYDIKVVEAAKALAGAGVGGVVDGVGVGAITLVNTPKGVVKAYQSIFEKDKGPVWKTTASLLVPPAAVLATPLGVVGGAFWGMAMGARKGYTEGFKAAVHQSVENLRDYHQWVRAALDD